MLRKIKFILTVLVSFFLTVVIVFFLIGYFFPPKAGLLVMSSPKARVFINGEEVGQTPYETKLKPEEVLVKIVPFDGKLIAYETKIKLVARVKTILQRDLSEKEDSSGGMITSFEKTIGKNSVISVISEPDGAQVVIDGQVRGFTPLEINFFEPGEHKLSLSLADYDEKEVNVRTYPGYKLTAFFKLPSIFQKIKNDAYKPDQNFKIEVYGIGEDTLKARENPDLSSNNLFLVKEGEQYDVLEKTDNEEWYKISKDENRSVSGWIPSRFAKKIDSP